LISFPLPT